MQLDFVCVTCRKPLRTSSKCCDINYLLKNNYLNYQFDNLLFENFKKDYLLNKVLNNNALLGYQQLPEGSLSLTNREDVKRFRDYIEGQVKEGVVLDMGCGLLELPGYLNFRNSTEYSLYGLDPIDKDTFKGFRIVGCSEFTPFPDESFDAIIFATSLDHVCSLKQTLKETSRILKRNGIILVWMGSCQQSLKSKIVQWLRSIKVRLKEGYDPGKYRIYPNWSVFHIPKGAVDPFHKNIETPEKTISSFKKAGFYLKDQIQNNLSEIFLTFAKK